MSYKYLMASSGMVKPPKETYIDDFKARLKEGFENSSDWFTVKQETPFASEIYEDVDARINYVIAAETGEKMSDDYKILWFKDVNHSVQLGTYFYFNDNYWLTINTEKVKSLANSVTVRRCNNTLRWIDSEGGLYTSPCASADPLIRENRDYATTGSAVVNVSGVIEIMTQFNERTNTIKSNQRFLFGNPGNWYCYKIFGAGVNNINLMKTDDYYSVGVLRYSMGGFQYNEDTDDLINGIADAKQYSYYIDMNQSDLFLNVGEKTYLSPTIYLNGKTVIRDIEWSSSNTSIAEINDGWVNPKQTGNVTISCHLKNNPAIYASIDAGVGKEPYTNYSIKISPKDNYVLETDKKIYTCYLYANGEQQGDRFTFSVLSGTVPIENYSFSVNGNNSFTVENKIKYLSEPLIIRCVSGIHTEDFSILLKGGW